MTLPPRLPGVEPYYDDGRGIVLYHGDCRELLPLFASASTDLVLTDPPYGIDYESWDERMDIGALVQECWRILVPDAYQLWFWPSGRFPDAFNGIFSYYHRTLIWSKPRTAGVSKHDGVLYQMEPIIVLKRGTPPYCKDFGFVYRDVIDVPIVQTGMREYTGHRAQKPLRLIKGLLARFAIQGAVILEPFNGSGTALVAARTLGMAAIGIEKDERSCAITATRLEQDVLPLFGEITA